MGTEIPSQEVVFLVLRFLKAKGCLRSFECLSGEAEELGLLPEIEDFKGGQHRPDFGTIEALFPHIPPNALEEACNEAHRLHSHGGKHGIEGTCSTILHAAGPCSLLPSVRQQPPVRSNVLPPSSQKSNIMQRLMQREAGLSLRSSMRMGLPDTGMTVKKWQHLRTFRGHRTAVYCATVTKAGKYVITGSDDCLIKIWNVRIGLLKATCRSHVGEITDLGLNIDQQLIASASTDSTVRIWSLKENELGRHLQVLVGHTAAVSFIDFHPVLRTALLSSSFDGTCRLWDTSTGDSLCVMKPGPNFASGRGLARFDAVGISTRSRTAAEEDQQQQEAGTAHEEGEVAGLSCCSFSPSGESFVVSSKNGNTYMWSWQVLGGKNKRRGPRTREQAAAGVPDVSVEGPLSPDQWPHPTELCVLEGHQADVALVLFSHNGGGLATASRDGQVRIWRSPKRKGYNSRPLPWTETLTLGTPPPPSSSRRRAQSASVNQVAWRCDDRCILAAYSTSSIYVWDAFSGDLVHHLNGHTAQVHVLECHPSDPRMCLSAGYDGVTSVWDIEKGVQLAKFSSTDTHPGSCKWADAIQLVDGHFLPDGQGIFVSDVSGQFSMYGPGSNYPMLRTPYDQFFLLDYDPVFQNEDGEVVDAESMEPQHRHGSRFSLCDYCGVPYDQNVQMAVLSGNLKMLPIPDECEPTPSGLLQHPPIATAAAWEASEKGLTQNSTEVRVQQAIDRQTVLEQAAAAEILAAQTPQVQEEAEQRVADAELNQADTGAPMELDDNGVAGGSSASVQIVENLSEGENGYAMAEDVPGPSESGPVGEEQGSEYVQSSSDGEQDEEYNPYTARRRRRRVGVSTRRRGAASEEEAEAEEAELDRLEEDVSCSSSQEESDLEAGGHRLRRRTHRPDRYSSGAVPETSGRRRGRKRRKLGQSGGQHGATCGRPLEAYSWLQESELGEQFYTPQKGDRIVYLVGVHQIWFDENQHNGTTMPDWAAVGDLRFAEPCEVSDVEYVILKEKNHPTVGRLVLTFMDRERPYYLTDIIVDVPPPDFGHEEFIVERHRFEQAVMSRWSTGESCKVWYFEGEGEGGQWWDAVVASDRLNGVEVEGSIWDCNSLHKRFELQWGDDIDDGSDAETDFVSPWELFARGSNEDENKGECVRPRLDEVTTSLLGYILEEVFQMPEAEHFKETLGPDASFPLASSSRRGPRRVYYNSQVALPMSLSIIWERVREPVYYRSSTALKHDLDTLLANAANFTGRNSEITKQAKFVHNFLLERLGEGDDGDEDRITGIPRRRRTRQNRRRRRSLAEEVTFLRSLDNGPNETNAFRASTSSGQTNNEGYQIRTRNMSRKRDRDCETESEEALGGQAQGRRVRNRT